MKQGQDLAGHLPAAEGYREALREGLSLARSGAMADDLRRLAEYLRFRYGIDPPPPEESRELVRRGRSLWQARGSILGHRARRDGPASEPVIRDDLLDFALAWADLGVRSASADRAGEARREALRVLAEAEALLGPSPAIDRERRVYSGGPDGPNPAPGTAPLTARDHHDLGRSYLRSGEVARAAEQFRHGLALRPQDFWLNFFEGLYAYRLGHFDDASAAFRVCIALSPETAECSYNRALARASLGQADLALADYSRALRLNPSLAEAALNRGILHFQAARLDEASADPDRALAASRDRGLRAIIRYNMAVVAMARGDRASALAHSGTASDLGHPGARELRKNLRPEPSRGPLPGPKSRSVFPAHRPSNSPGMISGMTVRTLTFGR